MSPESPAKPWQTGQAAKPSEPEPQASHETESLRRGFPRCSSRTAAAGAPTGWDSQIKAAASALGAKAATRT